MAFNVDTMKGRRNWAYATLGSVAALVIANKARKNRNAPPVRNCQNRQMANPDMDVMSDFNLSIIKSAHFLPLGTPALESLTFRPINHQFLLDLN